MNNDDLQYCTHEGNDTWEVHDARGIFLTHVCDRCEKTKIKAYRADVLKNSNYWTDEPIEES